MVLEGGLINAPEVYTDVKGPVTNDYQDVLEKQWIKELKAKYPVVIDRRILKTVNKEENQVETANKGKKVSKGKKRK